MGGKIGNPPHIDKTFAPTEYQPPALEGQAIVLGFHALICEDLYHAGIAGFLRRPIDPREADRLIVLLEPSSWE